VRLTEREIAPFRTRRASKATAGAASDLFTPVPAAVASFGMTTSLAVDSGAVFSSQVIFPETAAGSADEVEHGPLLPGSPFLFNGGTRR
jgi:hypothetical protein